MDLRIFFLTDNKLWFEHIVANLVPSIKGYQIEIFCSPKGTPLFDSEICSGAIKVLDLGNLNDEWMRQYEVGISAHCKQIFPAKLVECVRCYNIHPGFNPYNRGWFPQVFSIINKKKCGVTVHEMDAKIDHGRIIARKEFSIIRRATSGDVYRCLLKMEMELFDDVFSDILKNNFPSFIPETGGNYNSIADYHHLCEIDLDKAVTMGDSIDFLRAMTHPPYKNAFFYDSEGTKIFVEVVLTPESIQKDVTINGTS